MSQALRQETDQTRGVWTLPLQLEARGTATKPPVIVGIRVIEAGDAAVFDITKHLLPAADSAPRISPLERMKALAARAPSALRATSPVEEVRDMNLRPLRTGSVAHGTEVLLRQAEEE